MHAHHVTFLLSLLLLLFTASAITPSPAPKPVLGGYTPIKNLSDPHVIEVARFAVKEHNRQDKAHMVHLLRVLQGWTQVVAGINYRLILAVRPVHSRHIVRRYEALVYERPWQHFMNLTSFKPLREH